MAELQAVLSTHVNLVDLVDAPRTGQPVPVFKSEFELSDYTIDSEKFFPRANAYAGGLLRLLLRHILNPGAGIHRGRKRTRQTRH